MRPVPGVAAVLKLMFQFLLVPAALKVFPFGELQLITGLTHSVISAV